MIYNSLDANKLQSSAAPLRELTASSLYLFRQDFSKKFQEQFAVSARARTINLKEIIDSNIAKLKSNAEARELTLVNQLENDTYAFADPKLVSSVVHHLFSKAINKIDRGGEISSQIQENDTYIQLKIAAKDKVIC